MKARIPSEEEQRENWRKKGRELIFTLRNKGWSDDKIADSLGIPQGRWKQFLINIGINPFMKSSAEEKTDNPS